MREISRDQTELVQHTIGRHHQYPDGFLLFLGTLFAPIQDRDQPGQGFTHKPGDRVEIAAPPLGTLVNTVTFTQERGAYEYLGDSIRAFPRQPELAELMRGAGFTSARWTNLTFGIVALMSNLATRGLLQPR